MLLLVARAPWQGWTKRELAVAAVFGIATAAMNVFFYLAIDRTDLGKSVAIEFIGPIAVAAVMTRTRRNAGALALATVGVVVLGGAELDGNTAGLLWLLAASTMWAVYIVLGSRVAHVRRGVTGLGVGLAFGALALTPFGTPGSGPVWSSPRLLVACLLIGVFSNAIGYGIDQHVLRRIPVRRFSVLLALLPVTAVVLGWIVLDQTPTGLDLAGIALVLAGVVMQDEMRSPPSWRRQTPADSPVWAGIVPTGVLGGNRASCWHRSRPDVVAACRAWHRHPPTSGHRVAMLGTGLIGDFYTMALHAGRGRDRVEVVYSRTTERGEAFSERWDVPHVTTSIEDAVNHPDVDAVLVGVPNHLHEEAITATVAAGKPVLCTKPLARTAAEAARILDLVESAGVFAGYLEDLVYTPKTLKALAAVANGAIGDVMWVRSRETHPGPHNAWFWDVGRAGSGAIVDLGCHCIEIIRSYVGKGNRPVEVMCWSDTLVHPIEAEDNPIALIKFESGAVGQFEVSWTFRGGMDLRDEVAGTEGTIWTNHFLRTGFEMFSSGERRLRRREGRDRAGLAVPGRRRGRRARLHRDVHRHVRRHRSGSPAGGRRSTTATSSTR